MAIDQMVFGFQPPMIDNLLINLVEDRFILSLQQQRPTSNRFHAFIRKENLDLRVQEQRCSPDHLLSFVQEPPAFGSYPTVLMLPSKCNDRVSFACNWSMALLCRSVLYASRMVHMPGSSCVPKYAFRWRLKIGKFLLGIAVRRDEV